ncbi:MAG: transcriptional repressor NrdR [Clostridia bacterium]|nr:transcriptional repressor NrdR [Clostridia bacterium]
MKCPYCGYTDNKVLDSRAVDDRIRRRRECLSYARRFTTYEEIEHAPLIVIKKDMTREEFSKEKLLTSFRRACIKRDVPYALLERTVSDIEQELLLETDHEVPSLRIGELAMQKLLFIDDVAYVRFASVYKDFKDINAFRAVLESIDKTKNMF